MASTNFKFVSLFSLILLASKTCLAANNWTEPCTNGWCSWDTGDGNKTAFASLIVNGGTSGLSDVTSAAGWNVTGCNPDWDDGDHNVVMTCTNNATCNHLFNDGAPNTVVRLPPSCGKGPFAVVKTCQAVGIKASRAENSTTKIANGQKWAATLSYDFASVPQDSGKGPVSIFLTASNVDTSPQVDKRWAEEYLQKRGRESYLHKRGLFSGIGNAISGAAQKAGDAAKSAAGKVEGAAQTATAAVAGAAKTATSAVAKGAQAAATDAKTAAQAVATAAKQVAGDAANSTAFNKSDNEKLKPITVSKNFPIFDKSISCGGVTTDLSMNVDADISAQVSFGYVVIGSVVPPKLDDFNVMSTLNGKVTGTFNINMGLQGTFDTGAIPLFSTGLPGLSIPGIASIGPQFSLNAELSADMDIEAQMAVNTAFDLPNVNLVFPPAKGKSSAKANPTPSKTPLKISAGDSNSTSTGDIDAHIIPRLDFGVDILKGFAQATVFLQMDTSATLSMELDKSSTTAPKRRAAAPAKVKTSSGQVSLDGSIFIDGGLDGALGNLFSQSIDIPIFNTTHNFLTKTFGDAPSTKRSERRALKKAKPGPAAKIKQKISVGCFSSGSLLGIAPGTSLTSGFLSPLSALPI